MVVRRKAVAYVTNGRRLLVFEHPDFPDDGIQVPAGTIEPDEKPADAVMREAFEETGPSDLRLGAFLGECERVMSDGGVDEIHHPYFYHLLRDGECPATWIHFETDPHPSGRDQGPIKFRFYWVEFPLGVSYLIHDHGQMIEKLVENL